MSLTLSCASLVPQKDAVAAAAAADVTVLVLGLGCAIETEGQDRPNLTLPYVQEVLLYAIAEAVPPTSRLVVMTVSAGLVDVDPALADALLQVFIPGEEAGHGVADVLFGAVSPSGRLPLTGYKQEYLQLAGPVADFNLVSNSLGIGRTYRYADRIQKSLVRWGFGYGLSYTTWSYSNLGACPPHSLPPSLPLPPPLSPPPHRARMRSRPLLQPTHPQPPIPSLALTPSALRLWGQWWPTRMAAAPPSASR